MRLAKTLTLFAVGSVALFFAISSFLALRRFVTEGRIVISSVGDYAPGLRFLLWLALSALLLGAAVRGLRKKPTNAGGSGEKKEPIQPPQRNAGNRPPSDDLSASETLSSLGPRG